MRLEDQLKDDDNIVALVLTPRRDAETISNDTDVEEQNQDQRELEETMLELKQE